MDISKIPSLQNETELEQLDSNCQESEHVGELPKVSSNEQYLDVVVATKENTKHLGWFISDEEEVQHDVSIPFYDTVEEGAPFDGTDWKDQCCVRMARIHWKDDNKVGWMERHMEMTQGFICIGRNPGMIFLGEPTHDRTDLPEHLKGYPDFSNVKCYLIPAGCGIILKKGVWHEFPVSISPRHPLTVFIINTEEVVEALGSHPAPVPMDHGDVLKLRNSHVPVSSHPSARTVLRHKDPLPLAKEAGLI